MSTLLSQEKTYLFTLCLLCKWVYVKVEIHHWRWTQISFGSEPWYKCERKWYQHFHISPSTSVFVFSLRHMDFSSKDRFFVVCPKQTTSCRAVDRWRNIPTSLQGDVVWNVSVTISVLPSSSTKKRKSVNWLKRLMWTKWCTPLVIFTTFLKVRFQMKHLVMS